jgi:hypothetical protein
MLFFVRQILRGYVIGNINSMDYTPYTTAHTLEQAKKLIDYCVNRFPDERFILEPCIYE